VIVKGVLKPEMATVGYGEEKMLSGIQPSNNENAIAFGTAPGAIDI
jgi:hypothetical protein